MSRDLGRDVPDLEKLYASKLWADFAPYIIAIIDLDWSIRAMFPDCFCDMTAHHRLQQI